MVDGFGREGALGHLGSTESSVEEEAPIVPQETVSEDHKVIHLGLLDPLYHRVVLDLASVRLPDVFVESRVSLETVPQELGIRSDVSHGRDGWERDLHWMEATRRRERFRESRDELG